MKIYSYTLQGKRDSNEDQHIHYLNLNGENPELNLINFIGVFDGHGGKSVSKYLKQNLPQFFINKFNIMQNTNYCLRVDYSRNNIVINRFISFCKFPMIETQYL